MTTPKSQNEQSAATPETAAKRKPIKAARAKAATSKPEAVKSKGTKLEVVITLMRRPAGATIEQLAKATGWQNHSIRGVISGVVRKRMGLAVSTKRDDKKRLVYRIDARR